MTCSKCGSVIHQNETVCQYCGNKIKNNKTINDNNSNEENSNIEIIEIKNDTPNKVILMTNAKENSKNKSSDILSIIFGIIGLIPFFIPFSIISLILSYNYKKKTNKTTIATTLGITSLILQSLLFISLLLFNPLKKITNNTTPIEEINYQLIGSDKVGYLKVSKDWTLYESNNNSDVLQYRYLDTTIIISMYTIEKPNFTIEEYATNINSKMQNYETDNISIENVNIGKYQAIKQQAFLKNLSSYMTTWCFYDEYHNIHYIALNGTTDSTEHINIINTFKKE